MAVGRSSLRVSVALLYFLCLKSNSKSHSISSSAFLYRAVSPISFISPFCEAFPTLVVPVRRRSGGRVQVRAITSPFTITSPIVAYATAIGNDDNADADADADNDSQDAVTVTQTQQELSVEGFDLLSATELQRLCGVHETIQQLRQQIPVLLTQPLTKQQAVRAYTAQTRLLVGEAASADNTNTDDFELASSLSELTDLSTTLVLATEASVRASNFLSSSTSSLLKKNATTQAKAEKPVVECKILVDPEMKVIRVEWQTKVLSLLGSTTSTEASRIRGISMLLLDPVNGKIATHMLQQVQWRGQDQDSVAIGQALSTLRRTYLNLRESPFLQPFFSDSSPLSQVRDELLQQLSALTATSSSSSSSASNTKAVPVAELAPLFVVPSLKDIGSDSRKNRSTNTSTTSTDLVPINEWTPRNPTATATAMKKPRTPPVLPGSDLWMEYAVAHRSIVQFLDQIIPSLSKDPDVSSATIQSYFFSKAQLVALDGSLILQNAGRIANFYQSIAAWRRRSFASWTLDKATVLEWKGNKLRIQIDYTTSVNLPGAGSAPASIRGSDIFVLAQLDPSGVMDNGGVGMNMNAPLMVQIEQIQQKELSIGGNKNKADGVWFMRSVATAVESGLFRNNEESVLLDLVQRSMNMNAKRPSKLQSKSSVSSMEMITQPHLLSDAAAANVYRIMATLHRGLPKLLDDSASSDLLPPCHEYMADNMELHGYLGEVLLRGRAAYNRSVGLLVASLRAALRTGRVQTEQSKPSVQVELTAKGNVRLSMTLNLKILPIPEGFPGLDSNVLLQTSLPLKIGLISEYVIDADTGLISQHELIESRVNGQLTPTDIVSKWIRQRQVPIMGGAASTNTNNDGGSESKSDSSAAEESWMQTALDTVNWVRSLNKSS